jgi:hypothetical protein
VAAPPRRAPGGHQRAAHPRRSSTSAAPAAAVRTSARPTGPNCSSSSHALGEVPLVGFFAGGEIARHRLYGYTGVFTVFTD